MKIGKHAMLVSALMVVYAVCLSASAQSKTDFEVVPEAEKAKVVPTSFYFAGQSAPTQMRNAAAARIGKDRFIISGMVDTSGYSAEISGKYEGFLITDSPIKIGDKTLSSGAYGFGFSKDGNVNIFDLSAKQILSVAIQTDAEMKRPRPFQMISETGGIRLYRGRTYVLISPN